MKPTLAILAFVGAAIAAPEPSPTPQGVTGNISPKGGPPSGCSPSYSGNFEVTVVKPTAKRSLEERAACGGEGTLVLSLTDGKLTDSKDRTGYIASNYQYQFDAPPQAGAIYTSGFSVCGNGTLALGPSAVFWQCLSGNFYNLYDRKWAAQCNPVAMQVVPCGGSSPPPPSGGASSAPAPAPKPSGGASQAPDGQPQASSAAPISQITDGQPQASSAAPVPVSQITDGQPQASSAVPVPVISEKSDGQPNVPTPLVSQISDGQPQVTSAPPLVSQISDGQPQATSAVSVVSQISDGQPQAGNATVAPTPSVTPFPGAAAMPTAVVEFVALAAGVAALAML